jgi:ATP-dependent DNA ligase
MFPGKIIDNTFVYDELVYLDSKNKKRVYKSFVRMVKKKVEHPTNWNVLLDEVIHFTDKYLKGEEIPKCHVQHWTEYGQLDRKITRSSPKYPAAKHIGHKNERNILMQAMFETNAAYIKKKDETQSTSEIHEFAYVYPMLAVDKGTHNFPAYAQPKLNGQRCLAFKKGDEIVMYTRGLKDWPRSPALCKISAELEAADIGDYYLDGELYVHGKSLEELGQIRSSTYSGPAEYHVFDCFRLKEAESFKKRYKKLQTFKFKSHIKLVETIIIENLKEEDAYLAACLKKNYEGIMIREMKGVYKYTFNKVSRRSSSVIKKKPLYDAEFEVVGYTQGRGKDAGAIIWICRTEGGKEFNVVPKLNYSMRQQLFKDCEKNFGKFKNRMLKVEYRELSDTGVPLRAKAIDFRDFE